jgi:hypothetical protein
MHVTGKTQKKIKHFFGLLAILSAGVIISACSSGSGGSGGSASGAGSSSVQGNVASVNVAMLEPAGTEGYTFADLVRPLVPVKSAYAATTVEGIQVNLGTMQTRTNANGYFRFDGVPPGTHELRFEKNGYTSSMSVEVGENDMVTMDDINMNGRQARARNVSHRMTDNDRDMDRDDDRNMGPDDDDRDMDRDDDRDMGPDDDNHDRDRDRDDRH